VWVQAAPTKTSGPAFLQQGKFSIGVKTFTRASEEVDNSDSDSGFGSDSDSKQESTTSIYSLVAGYMVTPGLQVRLGVSLGSTESDDGYSKAESSRTIIEPGLRYYFQLSPNLFPFVGAHYGLISGTSADEEDGYGSSESDIEGSSMTGGGGLLFALGGARGGYASLSLDYASSERTRTYDDEYSDDEDKTKSSGFLTQIILGVYF